MKRTLTIVAAIVVALGILAGIYFVFFYNQSPSLTTDTTSSGNPFGESGAQSTTTAATTDTSSAADDTGNIPSQVAPKLVEISAAPVGRGFIVLDASTTPAAPVSSTTPPAAPSGVEVRYIDRESGNMYAYRSLTQSVTRLTNHTVPGVEEVSWLADGSAAYVRFLSSDQDGSEHIETYRLPADGTDGSFLARDLSDAAPENATTLFALAPNTSGSVGYVEKTDGTGPVTLFSSLLSSLSVRTSPGAMVAYTKPSAGLAGYAFLVDRKSGGFMPILGPLMGLSALPSPSGSDVLASYLDQGALRLGFYDTKSHATSALPVSTLSEKCVWALDSTALYCAVPVSLPSVALPDSWYQGTVSFSDRIWKIDFTARVATLVADLPTLTSAPIDAVSLSVDQNESTLVFMNKQDESLWAYSL